MAANRKTADDLDRPKTRGKLARLLQTEGELDSMLREARRSAEALVAAARADGEERVRQCEEELEDIRRALREQVERERDDTIASIRSEAQRRVEALNDLDEEAIAELAQYVTHRILGAPSGGRP